MAGARRAQVSLDEATSPLSRQRTSSVESRDSLRNAEQEDLSGRREVASFDGTLEEAVAAELIERGADDSVASHEGWTCYDV